nr:molybdopterin-binding protein [Tessaracoccus coleopterorum]
MVGGSGLGRRVARSRPRAPGAATQGGRAVDGLRTGRRGEPLAFGQIPDSNSVLLAGLCRGWGAEVVSAAAVDDDPSRFRAALAEALSADLVLTSGGVSVGAFEVVRQVVEGDVSFDKVAMQPGKPQASGTLTAPDGRRVPMLGLPGNPVSVFVSAWVYARPLIARLGGWSPNGPPSRSRWSRAGGDRRAGASSSRCGSALMASRRCIGWARARTWWPRWRWPTGWRWCRRRGMRWSRGAGHSAPGFRLVGSGT